MPKFITAYGQKRKVTVDFDPELEPSMTKQNHTAECDINNIMAKYQKTGQIDHLNTYKGEYADVSQMGDYQESIEIVRAAHDAFMDLPAQIRKEFDNDPGKFIHFSENPENLDRLVELGLATRNEAIKTNAELRDPDPLSVPPENKKDAS